MRLVGYLVGWTALVSVVTFTHQKSNELLSRASNESAGSPVSEVTAARLPDALQIKLLCAIGQNRLACDLIWLEFIQYIGDTRARAATGWSDANRYVDAITLLDPHFVQAYWFAAFSVGADEARPDLAVAILDRGIKENPGNWYLPYIAGINQFIYAHNDKRAAGYYAQAAALPGAPRYLREHEQILRSGAPSLLKQARISENTWFNATDAVIKARARDLALAKWQDVARAAPNDAYRTAAQEALVRLR